MQVVFYLMGRYNGNEELLIQGRSSAGVGELDSGVAFGCVLGSVRLPSHN